MGTRWRHRIPNAAGFAFTRLPPAGRGPSSARATRFSSFAALRTCARHGMRVRDLASMQYRQPMYCLQTAPTAQ